MKNKEIERKFLIDKDKIPFDLEKINYSNILQGYITSIDNSFVFRLRQILYCEPSSYVLFEKYFQTIKGKGSKIRDEYEIELTKEQFSKIWLLCKNIIVHKFRYELKTANNEIIYLDVYKNQLRGLYTAEVEFDTIEDCDAYKPESWFGEEVTNNYDYTNLNLSRNGLSK